MVNKVILVGNLGRDPERRSTPSGQQVATFSVATSRRWRDRDGNRQEQTEWHNIVVWGRQAEVAGEYLKKGRQIYLERRLTTRSWDDKQTGEKKYRTEVICENFQMLGQRGDSGGGGGSDYSSAPAPDRGGMADQDMGGGGAGVDDDDIPF